jgi:hypothetical protein
MVLEPIESNCCNYFVRGTSALGVVISDQTKGAVPPSTSASFAPSAARARWRRDYSAPGNGACRRVKFECPARRHTEQGVTFRAGGVSTRNTTDATKAPPSAGVLPGRASPSSRTRPEDHISNTRIELAGESSATWNGQRHPRLVRRRATFLACHAGDARRRPGRMTMCCRQQLANPTPSPSASLR